MPKLDKNQKTLQKAISTFGERKQLIKAIEELSELQKELCKHLLEKGNFDGISQEIADVEIMLGQLRIIFNSNAIDIWKAVKMSRLEERLRDEKNH